MTHSIDFAAFSLSTLVGLYNELAPKQISKFKDKPTAVEKLTAILDERGYTVAFVDGVPALVQQEPVSTEEIVAHDEPVVAVDTTQQSDRDHLDTIVQADEETITVADHQAEDLGPQTTEPGPVSEVVVQELGADMLVVMEFVQANQTTTISEIASHLVEAGYEPDRTDDLVSQLNEDGLLLVDGSSVSYIVPSLPVEAEPKPARQGRKSDLLGKKLTVLVPENPKRKGSRTAIRYNLYADCTSSDDFLAKALEVNMGEGAKLSTRREILSDLGYDFDQGYISLE